jgi:hypothetical protein
VFGCVAKKEEVILIELNLRKLILIKSELNMNWFMLGYVNLKQFWIFDVVWKIWVKITFKYIITQLGF